jgi:2-polyprenyl-3-methyl-5-hydroxy-6-metoxy-1,4-benzoquinol methylase
MNAQQNPMGYSMPPDRIGTEEQPQCYLCGSEGRLLHRDRPDYLFGAPGEWSFRQCVNAVCGMVWLDPRPTIDEIGKAYRQYYTHGDASAVRQSRFARTLRAVLHAGGIRLLGLQAERKRYKCMYLDRTPPGRLLEVGCGNGKRLARMRALGWDVTGQEVDPAAAEYVRREKGIAVHLGALETMAVTEAFDAIIMSHVIEHVHDPVALLAVCHRLLRENGVLVVLTPNAASLGHRRFGGGWRGLEPPRHLHLFNGNTLTRAVLKAGFTQPRFWTTIVGAYGIGEGSLPDARMTKQLPERTVCDVLRGFWFQLLARFVFLFDKNSGEECAVIARK